jgi:hypothetical protein
MKQTHVKLVSKRLLDGNVASSQAQKKENVLLLYLLKSKTKI